MEEIQRLGWKDKTLISWGEETHILKNGTVKMNFWKNRFDLDGVQIVTNIDKEFNVDGWRRNGKLNNFSIGTRVCLKPPFHSV